MMETEKCQYTHKNYDTIIFGQMSSEKPNLGKLLQQ